MSFLRSGVRLGRPYKPSVIHRHRTSYIVLLPEHPPDTADDNVLLRGDSLPQFASLTPEKSFNAVGKLALDYESGFWSMEEKLRARETTPTFNNVINELDKLDAPLTAAWSAVKLMYTTQNSDFSNEMYMNIHDRAKKARIHKFQSLPVFHACQEIKRSERNLSTSQHRVLDKYILEARLNGIELPNHIKNAFWTTLTKLEQVKSKFKSKIAMSTDRFSLQISNANLVGEFPDTLLKMMAVDKNNYKKGPWRASLHANIYPEFMKYCPSREMRKSCWMGHVMRGSNKLSKDLTTSEHISEIRKYRSQQAKILGYENFAHMSMETKMAGSVENVHSMIQSLLSRARKSQMKELNSLQIFAEERGFMDSLEEHDVAFWRRRQKRELYNFSESQIKEYFPFEHIWTQLLMLCSQLFGITFEEVAPDTTVTWHPDVRLFNVLDSNGTYISQFFLDPYHRPGEKLYIGPESAWALGLRNKSDPAQNTPISALIFNFAAPTTDTPSLLTFNDVNILFKRFGNALQHLLTTVPYGDAAGQTNIEWDSVDVCSNFMQSWLYEPSILERISEHYDSELPLSGSSIQDIISSRSHMAGYDLCNELYLSHLDLQLYSSNDYWLDIVKDIWQKYQAFELQKDDAHVCSFTPVLSDIWGAAYYSHIWSKMIAANTFLSFKEAQSDDDLINTGKRFRDTYLSFGGGCHPYEIFRQFCGRDPSPESLLDTIGID